MMGRCPCNYLKTYNLKLSRISLPLKIVCCEKACGLSGEVLGVADKLSSGPRFAAGRSGGGLSPDTEVRQMKAHPSLKPGIWGAVIGAEAISVIGFSSFGWTLSSAAEGWRKSGLKLQSRRAGADLRPKIPTPGRCIAEIGRIQQGSLMGPPVDHREGRLGNDAAVGAPTNRLGRK